MTARTGLIIGNRLEDDFFRINSTLREDTRTLGNIDDHAGYIPWACSIPVYGRELVKELLVNPRHDRGQLLADQEYLAKLAGCLSQMIVRDKESAKEQGNAAHYALKGNFDSWLPSQPTPEAIQLVADGREVLIRSWPSAEAQYEALVDYVVQVRPSSPARRRGFCTDYARGVIFREIPECTTPWEMGLDLANGLAHQALHVWKSVDDLLTSPYQAEIFSFRRGHVKPALLFYHEVIALAFTLRFARGSLGNGLLDQYSAAQARKAVDEMRASLQLSLSLLRTNCKFTPIGEALLSDAEAVMLQRE